MTSQITITIEDPTSTAASELISELSALLSAEYASSGADSFQPSSETDAVFLVARHNGRLVGCGAFRPIVDQPGVAEIKRMYSRPGTSGVGRAILAELTKAAQAEGYNQLWLETRRANERAINFYSRAGFSEREPYGKYVGRPEAICMEKALGMKPITF